MFLSVVSLETAADKLLAELESTRDLSQFIVHIDMDSFYASVEVRNYTSSITVTEWKKMLDDPSLIGKAFGVSQGVLSTASYEARKYGVRSGMPVYIAKKLCPNLIVVKSNYPRYSELSKLVMDTLRNYDPELFAAGSDEAYLKWVVINIRPFLSETCPSITEHCEAHQMTAEECVSEMRAKIFEQTKLTASAGIAPNKVIPPHNTWATY